MRWPHNTQGTPSKPGLRLILSKIDVTSKPPVGDISVVTLIRTDTTLDHSQKAEKVCHECAGINRQSNQTLCYWAPPLLWHWQLMRKSGRRDQSERQHKKRTKTRAARAPPVWHQTTSTDSPEASQNLGLVYLLEQRPRQTKCPIPVATARRFDSDLVTS